MVRTTCLLRADQSQRWKKESQKEAPRPIRVVALPPHSPLPACCTTPLSAGGRVRSICSWTTAQTRGRLAWRARQPYTLPCHSGMARRRERFWNVPKTSSTKLTRWARCRNNSINDLMFSRTPGTWLWNMKCVAW